MSRPKKCRRIVQEPSVIFYKPRGVPMHHLKGVILQVEGLEAIRLADAEGLEHDAAAGMMNVSRPTFSRILAQARKVVAKGLSSGSAIRIEGGEYEIAD